MYVEHSGGSMDSRLFFLYSLKGLRGRVGVEEEEKKNTMQRETNLDRFEKRKGQWESNGTTDFHHHELKVAVRESNGTNN